LILFELVCEFLWDFLGIYWEFFGRFLGLSYGILWKDFSIFTLVSQDFGFCQDFVSMHKEDKFRSLEVQEASSSHLKTLYFMQTKGYYSNLTN
jgi:hypothetical protein